jgi:hypothetical protein
MAGAVVRVAPTRTFDFSGVFVNSQVDFVVKSGIDAREWLSAALVIKVSSADVASGTTITVGALLEGQTPEDPSQYFVSSTLLGSVVIDGFQTPPYTLVAPLGVPLGAAFRVIARGSRVSGVAGGNLLAMLSVDACLKNG